MTLGIQLKNGELRLRLHESWVRYWPEDLERLGKVFRAEPDGHSQEIADRLERALEAYNSEKTDA